MTQLKTIYGPKSRLALLKLAHTRLQQELASGRFSLIDPRMEQLPILIERLETASAALDTATRQRKQVLRARDERANGLYQLLSHFQVNIQKRSTRFPNSEALSELYPFGNGGLSKVRKNYQGLLTLAKSLNDSEARALAAGFEANPLPSLAEVTAFANDAEPLFSAAERAHHDQKQAQAELQEVQAAVGGFLKILLSYLRFASASFPKKAQRDILRTFGFRFSTNPSQEAEPDTATGQDASEDANQPSQQPETTNPKSGATKARSTAA